MLCTSSTIYKSHDLAQFVIGMMTPGKRGPKRSKESAFLALVPKLEKALAVRRKIVELYEEHGPELGISYSQFARYVARYITGKVPQKPKGSPRAAIAHRVVADAAGERNPPTPKRDGPISTPATTARKFEFDPTRANKPGREEELF